VEDKNAKTELQSVLASDGIARLLAAKITFGCPWGDDPDTLILPMRFGPDQERLLWEFLDRQYDSGYGEQKLFGIVWLQDGSWLTRGEYDGKEWWEHNKRPLIPRR